MGVAMLDPSASPHPAGSAELPLIGAAAIAAALGVTPRAVYHLRRQHADFPVFAVGSGRRAALAAFRTDLARWFTAARDAQKDGAK